MVEDEEDLAKLALGGSVWLFCFELDAIGTCTTEVVSRVSSLKDIWEDLWTAVILSHSSYRVGGDEKAEIDALEVRQASKATLP